MPRPLRSPMILALAVFSVLTGSAGAQAGDAADWARRHAALDASLNSGNGYAAHDDSSTLAWAESYILSSYLAMYEASGDNRYLDTFRSHVDQVLASASDLDGDTLLEWSTHRYSETRIQNGDFDERDCSLPDWLCPAHRRKLPRHWSRWQSSHQTAYREVESGEPVAVVKTAPGRGWQVLETRLTTYTPGARYQILFRGRTNGGAAGGRVDVIDRTAGGQVAQKVFTDTAWRSYAITFDAPAAAGHELLVRLYHQRHDVAGEARFDGFTVKKRIPWMVHDGMITWPMAAFAATVRNDPDLANRYGRAASRYVAFIQTHVLPRWESLYRSVPGGGGTYVFPADTAYGWHGNSQPHNQVLALGRTFVHLYRATGVTAYRTRARELARAFRGKLVVDGAAYRWRYSDVMLGTDWKDQTGWEDTSHANIELGFALDMNALGDVFTDADIARFVATFEQRLWNRSWSAPSLASNVDGGGDERYAPYISEWVRLGDVAGSRVQRIADSLYEHESWAIPGSVVHGPTSMLVAAHLSRHAGIQNGDMEVAAPADPTLPAGWERWQSSARTAFRDRSAAVSGTHGASVLTDPSRGWQVLQHRIRSYPASTELTLTFRARTNGSAAGGRVDVLDRAAGRVLATRTIADARWRRYSLRFTTPPVATSAVWVRVLHQRWNVAGGAVHVDDLRVVTGAPANGDFEAPELVGAGVLSGGRLLPAKWQRWQATGATAFLDGASARSGRVGLTIRTNPSRGWQVVEQRLDSYAPGQQVQLSLEASASSSAAGARAQVYDFTAGASLAEIRIHDSTWRRHAARWRMPADPDHDIRVRLMHVNWNVSNATARFDDVTLTPVQRAQAQPRPATRRP